MNNSRDNGLLGASRIQIRITGSGIELTAEMGGVRRLMWGVTLTLLSVFGFLLITFSVLAMLHKMPSFAPWLALAPAAPWAVIGPWIAQSCRDRTKGALDALLQNMRMLEPQSAAVAVTS